MQSLFVVGCELVVNSNNLDQLPNKEIEFDISLCWFLFFNLRRTYITEERVATIMN